MVNSIQIVKARRLQPIFVVKFNLNPKLALNPKPFKVQGSGTMPGGQLSADPDPGKWQHGHDALHREPGMQRV